MEDKNVYCESQKTERGYWCDKSIKAHTRRGYRPTTEVKGYSGKT